MSDFEWDEAKYLENQQKHGVSFYEAQHAFLTQSVSLLKMYLTVRMKDVIFVLA